MGVFLLIAPSRIGSWVQETHDDDVTVVHVTRHTCYLYLNFEFDM